MLQSRLDHLQASYGFFDQHNFTEAQIQLEVSHGRIGGWLRLDRKAYLLSEFRAVYSRLVDDEKLPELCRTPPDSALRRHCRRLHDVLTSWMEIAPGVIINRGAPSASNSSKPYQCQLIRQHGFLIPETLITSVPERVLEFQRQHGRVIYKSLSGTRSIVKMLESKDIERLERIDRCPTQFQAYVKGTNIRVHVVETASMPPPSAPRLPTIGRHVTMRSRRRVT